MSAKILLIFPLIFANIHFHSLAIYLFYSKLYFDEQKRYPKYDLVIAAVLAFIWLCAASTWAHAVLGLRSIADVEVQLVVRWKKTRVSQNVLFSVLHLY